MGGVAEGIRVLDFTWYGVGPITTKYLADNGADVIKVESRSRPDSLRMAPPWKDGTPGINNSQFFGSFNSSKKSLTVDLSKASGRDVIRKLVPLVDVVADSFTAGTMGKWGLGYPELTQLRSDIIQFSTCMQGQTGPNAKYPGFGNLMASLSGFYYLAGYSPDDIAPPYGAYTDFIAPRFGCFALIAALDYRRRTGQGQFIDMSQYEAALQFIAPAVMDYFSSGTVLQPEGNRSSRYAPHGAFRVRDQDSQERWVALAVQCDTEWVHLLEVLGVSPGPADLATQVQRLLRFRDVDRYIQDRVGEFRADELVAALQAAGVPAYPVQSCLDLHSDENLVEFGFWQWLEQSDCGPMPYDGLAYRLERTPGQQTAAPSLGEHTEEILSGLLGMNSREIAELAEDGAIN